MPFVAERQDRLAGARVDRLQEAVDREEQPLVFAVLALPVVDAAARHAVQPFVDPDLLARRGVERDQRSIPARTYITSSTTTGLKPAAAYG